MHFLSFKNKTIMLIITVSFSFALAAASQKLPDNNIVVFDLSQVDGDYEINNPLHIATGSGYDNQPFFKADSSEIYFTRIENDNADIWSWSYQKKQAYRLLDHPLSEYSPTQIPFEPQSISMIRVEDKGEQRLWKYHPEKGYQVIFNSIEPVGYHVWSNQHIAMFILGEPHSLQITQLGQEKTTTIALDIGRCLQQTTSPDEISFTQVVDKQHYLTTYNFSSQQLKKLIRLPADSQDYIWLDRNQVVSSDGDNLMLAMFSGKYTNQWRIIQNRSKFRLAGISRLAISPDKSKIAVVYEK